MVDGESTSKHFTTNKTLENVPAEETEAFIEAVVENSEDIGMRVNCKKTQLLCISADNGCSSSSNLEVRGERIDSVDKIKLLGFMVGSRPGVHDHMQLIREKFRVKLWSMLHLKHAGIVGDNLFGMYCCFVRPIFETNSVIFHSMLTREQSRELEQLQKKLVKLCFGINSGYAAIREEKNIMTLEHRRVRAAEKFVAKTIEDKRFGPKWYKKRQEAPMQMRRRNIYVEERARTERFRKSPLLYFQRVANTLT